MKIQEKCLPCIVNQVLKVANMVGLQEKEGLLKKVFSYLSEVDYQTSTTPELIGEIFLLLKQETGNKDPYRETRIKYNTMFLEQLPTFEQKINSSDNPFLVAIKYAIMGNIIDFNPIHNYLLSDIQNSLLHLDEEQLVIDDSQILMEEIKQAKSILYLGDNCGEICLDKLMLKKIKELNPSCKIYFGTRGEAVINDSIEEDAYFVGIDTYATVVSNGDYSLGTVLRRTTSEFQDIYHNADIIIAKGQANYESLSTEKGNVYFLLMTKCGVIADDIGVPEMKMVCMKSRLKFGF
ncbi:MAG TPA: ARMT1-like domain-containing protein [Lachnospiraceae bacterium]|nr:ARMT1-like domain-containing protein [Lachnospiraceae bacterium]